MATKKRLVEAMQRGMAVGTLDLNLQHVKPDAKTAKTILSLGVVRIKESLMSARTVLNVFYAWTDGCEGRLNPTERMLLDMLNGCKGPWEIHEQTGLPMERCQEIYDWYKDVPEEMINR